MFTKLFNKSHDPYELGGRWYKMRISITTDGATVLESDIPEGSFDPIPSSLAYVTSIDDNEYIISIVHGMVIDYVADLLSGALNMSDFDLSVSYGDVPASALIMKLVAATVDLYLYIVER